MSTAAGVVRSLELTVVNALNDSVDVYALASDALRFLSVRPAVVMNVGKLVLGVFSCCLEYFSSNTAPTQVRQDPSVVLGAIGSKDPAIVRAVCSFVRKLLPAETVSFRSIFYSRSAKHRYSPTVPTRYILNRRRRRRRKILH